MCLRCCRNILTDTMQQRMELALDCRAGKTLKPSARSCGEAAQFRNATGTERVEEKLYRLLTEGIPAMQKLGTVYISQAIKQMRVTKLPNIRLGISLSAGLLNLDIDVEGMDQAQLFDILSRYDRRKKYFRLKDGSFLDVSDGQLRELSALKDEPADQR